MPFHAVHIWYSKAKLIEKCVQGQIPGHKILRRYINQNCPDFFSFYNLRLLFQCQSFKKWIFFKTSDIWNLLEHFFFLLATQGKIKSSGRAEGFGMKGQGTEVASPTFTQPLFIPDHHRAQMTLKYSIDCKPSCVCVWKWGVIHHKWHFLLLFFLSLNLKVLSDCDTQYGKKDFIFLLDHFSSLYPTGLSRFTQMFQAFVIHFTFLLSI